MTLKCQAPLSSQALDSVSRPGDDGHHSALHRTQCCAQPAPARCWGGEGLGKCPHQEGGDISVGEGHTGAKHSKDTPLLPASLSRVRKNSRERLQRADGTYLQHRQAQINVRSGMSCSPSSMCPQGPCRTRCSPQHEGTFPCLTPQTSTIPEEKASRNFSHCATPAELSDKPPRGYPQPKTLGCRFAFPSQSC